MDTAAISREWVGRVVDNRFTLLEWLGGSGHSSVYLTERSDKPGRKAAIKFEAAGESNSARIADWAAATDFSHPHLMSMLAFGRCEMDGVTFNYSVTDYSDEILADILPIRALTDEEVREMLDPVIDALGYLHAQGFIHGRLKPSNLLVVNDQLKLSVDSIQSIGAAMSPLPSLSIYDAPERAEGDASVAVDIWSLGTMLVEAMTQETPEWDRSSNSNPMVPTSIPEPLAAIARGCLQENPQDRWTLEGIDTVLHPERAAAKRIDATAPGISAKPRWPVLAVSAVVLITAVLLLWMRSHEPQIPATSETQNQATEQETPSAVLPRLSKPKAASSGAAAPTGQAAPIRQGSSTNGAVAQRVQPAILPAAQSSIQGTVNVRIRLNVGADGAVTGARFDSAGPSKYFAKTAMDAAQQWKFRPAQVNGRPASSVWVLQFVFTRGGVDITPAQQAP